MVMAAMMVALCRNPIPGWVLVNGDCADWMLRSIPALLNWPMVAMTTVMAR